MKRRELDKANEYMREELNIAKNYKVNSITISKLYDNYSLLKEMEGKLDRTLFYYEEINGEFFIEKNQSCYPYCEGTMLIFSIKAQEDQN